jgi:hypothetical protein
MTGDYNDDGFVDAADYVVWRKGFATGAYTQHEYNAWRSNFGATIAGAAAVAHPSLQSVVPEPNALVLATLAGGGVTICRRRSRRSRRACLRL